MSTVADYAGRYIDVMAYQGVMVDRDAQLTMAMATAGNSGTICTGTQKLAQRFLIRLMTRRGSMPYQPTEGCNFMTRLLRGDLRTSLDVYAAFSAALIDIRRSMRNEETEERLTRGIIANPEEVLASAKITQLTIIPGKVTMTITITSKAGSSRAVILPIATTLRGVV